MGNPKTEFGAFFATNMASGGLAGAGSLTIVYPLDYARTRLASDVGSGTPQFSGLGDYLMKTMQSGGFFSMYAGFGVSVVGIVAYRGPYFGVFDTLKALNPSLHSAGWGACIEMMHAIRAPRPSADAPQGMV